MSNFATVDRFDDVSAPSGSATYDNVASELYPKQREELLKAIKYLSDHLEDDWHGGVSIKPTKQSLVMAKCFVERLFLNRRHADFVEPDGDGGLILRWEDEDSVLLLTIDGLFVHLSHRLKDSEPVFLDDLPFFDAAIHVLPAKVLEKIPFLGL